MSSTQTAAMQVGAIVKRGSRDNHGQGLIEYALIVAVIAIAAMTIIGTIGGEVVKLLTGVNIVFLMSG